MFTHGWEIPDLVCMCLCVCAGAKAIIIDIFLSITRVSDHDNLHSPEVWLRKWVKMSKTKLFKTANK